MNSSMIIISFIFFAGLVAVITYFKTRNDNMETSDGYFLGGRSLTAIVVAGSLIQESCLCLWHWYCYLDI